MSIRVPVEISRALYSNSLALPVLLQLARSLQCIFRAFRVRTDMHKVIILILQIKNYFRKIMSVGLGRGLWPLRRIMKFKNTCFSTKTNISSSRKKGTTVNNLIFMQQWRHLLCQNLCISNWYPFPLGVPKLLQWLKMPPAKIASAAAAWNCTEHTTIR